MQSESRISLNDNLQDATIKMAGGNPGAVRALIECAKEAVRTDPDSGWKDFTAHVALDEYGIYDSAIYILWSDVCERDTRKMLMLLRAVQLGILSRSKLQAAAADQMRGEHFTEDNLKTIDDMVCSMLPRFRKPE